MGTIRNCILNVLRVNYSRYLNPTILSTHFCTKSETKSLNPHPNCVQKLQDLFELQKSTAFNLLHDNKKFANVSANEIEDTFNYCIKSGIKKQNLFKYLDVLTTTDICRKLELLNHLPYDLNDTLSLIELSEKLLSKLVEQDVVDNRIELLSNSLNITVEQACYLISKRPFLITLKVQHIEKCFELLKEYGITKEEIIKDLWVLKYSVENIDSRLQLARDSNVEKIKTWMVRVPPQTFENTIRRHADNKIILGKNSFVEYLSKKLQCSEELIKYIIFKHPPIANKNVRKMNEIIEFLLSKGFTTQHICKTPRILLHCKNTIADRLKLLENHEKQLTNLTVLTKSNKQFVQFLTTKENSKKSKTS